MQITHETKQFKIRSWCNGAYKALENKTSGQVIILDGIEGERFTLDLMQHERNDAPLHEIMARLWGDYSVRAV